MQSCGVRPSVCLSVCLKHFAQIASSTRQITGSLPNLHMMVPERACVQDVLQFKVEIKGHLIPAYLVLGISQKSILAGKWLHPDQTQSFPNFPLPFVHSVFFRISIPKWLWVFIVSSPVAHMVKQFVKLFAIQYGLTFCLYVRSLYEAPLHCPSRLSIRLLHLMSKSWNELLRYWRYGSVLFSCQSLVVQLP